MGKAMRMLARMSGVGLVLAALAGLIATPSARRPAAAGLAGAAAAFLRQGIVERLTDAGAAVVLPSLDGMLDALLDRQPTHL